MKARGFTLLELMIAMMLGTFVLGGILSTYVISRDTTEDSFSTGELQENGRLAMSLLADDIKWAGFWGDYTGLTMQQGAGVSLTAGANINAGDCLDERSEGSLPSGSGLTRPIWGERVSGSGTLVALGCIPNSVTLVPGSDVLSIKRVMGNPIANATALADNRFYLAANNVAGVVFRGNETRPSDAALPARQVWEYQHHLYYLSEQDSLPRLNLRYLTSSGMPQISGPLVEGIEQLTILYGVDDSAIRDGQVDRYVNAGSVSPLEWSQGRVLAARIYVLVRAIRESTNYVNNNTYQVGDVAVSGNGDGYRRLLLQSTVQIRNTSLAAGGS